MKSYCGIQSHHWRIREGKKICIFFMKYHKFPHYVHNHNLGKIVVMRASFTIFRWREVFLDKEDASFFTPEFDLLFGTKKQVLCGFPVVLEGWLVTLQICIPSTIEKRVNVFFLFETLCKLVFLFWSFVQVIAWK